MSGPILVPLDGSPFSERAIPAAIAIARRNRLAVELVLIHEPFVPAPEGPRFLPLVSPVLDNEWRSRRGAYVRDLVARAKKATTVDVRGTVMDGAVAAGIAEHATNRDARMVVLATHAATPGSRLWLASVPRAISHMTQVPVLFVKPDIDSDDSAPERFSRVLVPLDGSALSDTAIDHATLAAGKAGVEYTLLRVITAFEEWEYGGATWAAEESAALTGARDHLSRHARRLRRQKYSVRTAVLRKERPADAILAFAREREIELIALTTHSRSAASRFLRRSVADRIAREPAINALVARGQPAPESASARRSRQRARAFG